MDPVIDQLLASPSASPASASASPGAFVPGVIPPRTEPELPESGLQRLKRLHDAGKINDDEYNELLWSALNNYF